MSSDNDGPKTKRMRIDECISLVQERKAKEESESEVNNLLNMINFGQSDQRGGFSSEERELRKDRGDRLLQLFREQPSLSNSASARRVEKNYERAVIWEEITKKINEEFGKRLELLTVDKVKKLLTYYKKKEEGNFDFIKLPPSSMKNDNSTAELKFDELIEMNESASPTHNENQISEILSMLSSSLSNANNTKSDSSPKKFLPLVIPPAACSESSTSSTSTSTSSSFTPGEQIYILKKERHDFVVKLAEYYIQRMCFDNSSRSAAVNAERHNMWIRITQQTNEKYAPQLGALGVEQSKKLYSNCKRRRRIKNENDDSPGSFQSTARASVEPDAAEDTTSPDDEETQESSPNVDLLCNVDSIIKGLEKDAEIIRLKETVKEQSAKIDKLNEFIVQQDADFKKQMLLLLEEVKTRVLNTALPSQ